MTIISLVVTPISGCLVVCTTVSGGALEPAALGRARFSSSQPWEGCQPHNTITLARNFPPASNQQPPIKCSPRLWQTTIARSTPQRPP